MIKDLSKKILRKPLKFLSDRLAHTILEETQQILSNCTNQIDEKLTYEFDELKLLPEAVAVNTAAFEEYNNKYMDRDVVVIGAGPTLQYYHPIKDAIHIGVNRVYRDERLSLDYYFAHDFRYFDEEWLNDIANLKCKVFLGRSFHGKHEKNIASESFIARINATKYFYSLYPSKHIYADIRYHPLMNFKSTIFAPINFALFTNPKRLYLVGCDVSYSGYFTGEKQEMDSTEYVQDGVEKMLAGYQRVKQFASRYYPETEIISINPVNLRGLFIDEYTDEYLAICGSPTNNSTLFGDREVTDAMIRNFVDEHFKRNEE